MILVTIGILIYNFKLMMTRLLIVLDNIGNKKPAQSNIVLVPTEPPPQLIDLPSKSTGTEPPPLLYLIFLK
jgi:hypothetical protein